MVTRTLCRLPVARLLRLRTHGFWLLPPHRICGCALLPHTLRCRTPVVTRTVAVPVIYSWLPVAGWTCLAVAVTVWLPQLNTRLPHRLIICYRAFTFTFTVGRGLIALTFPRLHTDGCHPASSYRTRIYCRTRTVPPQLLPSTFYPVDWFDYDTVPRIGHVLQRLPRTLPVTHLYAALRTDCFHALPGRLQLITPSCGCTQTTPDTGYVYLAAVSCLRFGLPCLPTVGCLRFITGVALPFVARIWTSCRYGHTQLVYGCYPAARTAI